MSDQKKPSNLKTALILLIVALMFFLGLFVKRLWLS
ncbi:cytochrome oxidase small assembly protein [Noviherbaspirillum cavernae]|nr:cytochrome oxidase small assembly protein [Noviherbaspirillum cavernae]